MKKISENERLAQQIYASQMLKLQGKILEKKLSKNNSKNQYESLSQNISNNNSPVVGRQKSYENLQKMNRTFINSNIQVTQQKLNSILNVMAGQQSKSKNQLSFNNELINTVKISNKLRKNQSMIQIDQQSPPLTKNASFHRHNSSVKNKMNSNSLSNENSQIIKIKEKIKILLQERDKNLQQDQKEIYFMIKFNQTLNQLLGILFQDSQGSTTNIQNSQLASSSQDTFQALQIDHFFKRQIQILQGSSKQLEDKKKLENILSQMKKKQETLQTENQQLFKQKQQSQETINQLKQQLNDLQNCKQKQQDSSNDQLAETLELKYLVQGQFEAIQKLLQREQLMKVFLKRVGDSSIIEMFEQFLQNAEYVNQDDTEGNLNINLLQDNTQKQTNIQPSQKNNLPEKIIEQFESSYKQLNLCDSQQADDSRVNDSDESSFGFIGKEQATEVSCYFGEAQQFKEQSQQLQYHQQLQQQSQQQMRQLKQKDIKDKLKINMMDVQLAQAAQFILIIIDKSINCQCNKKIRKFCQMTQQYGRF